MEHRRLGQGRGALLRRVLAGALLALVPVAGAGASLRLESVFEDPLVLTEGRDAVLDEIDALGADTLRVLVVWRDVARDGWGPLDGAVRGARARGLRVLLTPTGPGPRAASGCRPRRPACRPSVRGYGRFVRRAGRRYPAVDRWSLYNEPNLPRWLEPQLSRRGARVAGAYYRRLARAGVRALRATGHRRDTILLGETAPVGGGAPDTYRTPPVDFVRDLFARGPVPGVTGYAHHPYTLGAAEPPGGRTVPGQISFEQLGRLGRLLPGRMPLWLTEFGYQTNPPDPRLGVPWPAQAEYLNRFEFVAARDPRVRAVAQYKLVDDRDPFGFQTGLRTFGALEPKPALDAYALPIWVTPRLVYGHVRVAGGRRVRVTLTRDGRPLRRWSVRGPFVRRLRLRPGRYALTWRGHRSRTARL